VAAGAGDVTSDAKSPCSSFDGETYTGAKSFEEHLRRKFGHQMKALNLGVSGAMISDDLALLKKYVDRQHELKAVFLLIAPRDFVDANLPDGKDSRIYKLVSKPGLVERLSSAKDLRSMVEPSLEQIWTFFRVRADYRQLMELATCNYFRRRSSLYASLADTNNKFAEIRVDLPTRASQNNSNSAIADYRKVLRSYYEQAYSKPRSERMSSQINSFNQILKLCAGRDIRAVVVNMPLSREIQTLLPANLKMKYVEAVRSGCARFKADSIDLGNSSYFSDSDFSDGVHLNADGARKLWIVLAQEAARLESLNSTLNTIETTL
jgi:lysophospholipase L1-like esterase